MVWMFHLLDTNSRYHLFEWRRVFQARHCPSNFQRQVISNWALTLTKQIIRIYKRIPKQNPKTLLLPKNVFPWLWSGSHSSKVNGGDILRLWNFKWKMHYTLLSLTLIMVNFRCWRRRECCSSFNSTNLPTLFSLHLRNG